MVTSNSREKNHVDAIILSQREKYELGVNSHDEWINMGDDFYCNVFHLIIY
jgi:hypothetical protein